MTNTEYNYSIDFHNINLYSWADKEESFENMCKEFFIKKYSIIENVNLVKGYSGIECPPVLGKDDKHFSFQAKLLTSPIKAELKKSFLNEKKGLTKIKQDDLSKMDLLVIFSNKEVTEEVKNEVKKRIGKSDLVVEYRVGEDFKSELNKPDYINIRQKYFFNKDVQENIHKGNKGKIKTMNEICKVKSISTVENCFFGNIPEKDIENAREYQQDFLLNKYLYCDSESFDIFEKLEKNIPNTKFRGIELHTNGKPKDCVEDILEYAKSELDTLEENELVDLKYFTPDTVHKKGLFINYGAEDKCQIKEQSGKIVFISKIDKKGMNRYK